MRRCFSTPTHIRVTASRRCFSVLAIPFPARLALFEELQRAASARARPELPLPVCHVTLPGLPGPLHVPAHWQPVQGLRSLRDAGFPVPGCDADPVVAARVVGGPVLGLRDALPPHARALALEYLTASSPEGRRVYWHSGAHVLGAALEAHFGAAAWLCDGPATLDGEGGFYYELELAGGARVDAEALPALEACARTLVAARAPFERLEVTREEAAALFEGSPRKGALLARVPRGEALTAYRCGPFVDLCRGPHVPHTGLFRALKLHRVATGGAPALQRVHGVAFPAPAQLVAWGARLEEAKRRDHRAVGKAQGLFFFHELSPGSAFMLPHGTRIVNRLLELLRGEYRRRGYEEVATPLLFKKELWATSGHLEAYAGEMFSAMPGGLACGGGGGGGGGGGADDDDAVYGLKPMNCPAHCLIFANRLVTQRELPLRFADFSALHRNEASGALGGLTRLRRFAQDDAHVFCTEAQVAGEVGACLDFVAAMYRLFGFTFRAKLSTRPPHFVGDAATWDAAEAALGAALRAFLERGGGGAGAAAAEVEVDAGGGAFYGPKVDVFVRDALGREHQCATVQLDFQLPRRFGLRYRVARGGAEEGGEGGPTAVPVLIHRAVLGSIERMLGILAEHTAGKWPFWVSPRQVLVCTVAERHAGYAERLAAALRFPAPHRDTGLWVEVDASARTVGKKVREGQRDAHNLLLVVGDAEEAAGAAAVRFRDAATLAAFGDAWARVDAPAARAAGAGGWRAAADAAAEAGAAVKAGGADAAVFEGPVVTLGADALRDVCVLLQAERL
jgi:threonyl-tRNA synthetase